jgi:molybdenum cofactor biosynthesis enzyme MoaA
MLNRLRSFISGGTSSSSCQPKKLDLELLQGLHREFAADVEQREDVLFQGLVNNSDFMLDIVTRRLAGGTGPSLLWIAQLPSVLNEGLAAGILDPYSASFVAAVLAVAAETLLSAGRTAEALSLAEKAINQNVYDAAVQRILLACRAETKGERARIDDTEEWLKTRFCAVPFEHLETLPTSEIVACCGFWLPVSVGNLATTGASIEGLLDSPSLNRVKSSILDGSFRYCSRMHCPKIAHRTLPARNDVDIEAYQTKKHPKEVVFSHDQTCNLTCPSCRKNSIIIRKSEQARFDALSPFLLPLMINADMVKVCGSGDPFASNHFRNLLKSYCSDPRAHRNIVLHTNGVLCDQRAWEELGLRDYVKAVWLSLDAATEETYNYTRRDGDWNRVLRNVDFLSELRSTGSIESLLLFFVVQGRNYKEMVEFVELGKEFRADGVVFQAIFNWGTYTEQEFLEHNIFSPKHPKHAEFVDMLEDDIFDDPIIELTNVAAARRAKRPGSRAVMAAQ